MERILIIDNNSQAEVLKSILSGDYNVMVSKSGREGIISAKSGKFALILLNASIPDMEEFCYEKTNLVFDGSADGRSACRLQYDR